MSDRPDDELARRRQMRTEPGDHDALPCECGCTLWSVRAVAVHVRDRHVIAWGGPLICQECGRLAPGEHAIHQGQSWGDV